MTTIMTQRPTVIFFIVMIIQSVYGYEQGTYPRGIPILKHKEEFLVQHDREHLLPKITEVFNRMQNARDTPLKNTLERELTILTSQYYNQLSAEQLQQLRAITAEYHQTQKEQALSRPIDRQRTIFEVLFI